MASNLITDLSANASGNRRHRAIVALLLSLPSLSRDSIDYSHDIISKCSITEFNNAYEEAVAARSCNLVNPLKRLMGDSDEFSFAPFEEWTPIQQAQYRNLSRIRVVSGMKDMIISDVDVWSVLRNRTPVDGSYFIIMYVRSLISKGDGVYYLSHKGVIKKALPISDPLSPLQPLNGFHQRIQANEEQLRKAFQEAKSIKGAPEEALPLLILQHS